MALKSISGSRRFGAVVVAAVTLWLCPHVGAQTDRRLAPSRGERRVALVVGNDTYAEAPLRNARNDARAVSRALEALGFNVRLLEDATRPVLVNALAELGNGLQANDVALFYFAGHGVQVDGENFLVPADFRGHSATEVRLGALKAGDVQQSLQTARVSMLILDACRNNPFASTRGGGGLAPMESRGSLIAFATGAGQTAADGTAGNGLFTQELLKAWREPDLKAQDVFQRVRQSVYSASGGKQVPAVYDGLLGDFVFRAAPASAPAAAAVDKDLARREELALWEAIKDSKNVAVFEDFLSRYPSGLFSVAARDNMARLRAPAAPGGGPRASTSPPPTSPPAASASKLPSDQLANALIDTLNADCASGQAAACGESGYRYRVGRGVTRDEARAVAQYQRGCDGGDARGCAGLGLMYADGLGVAKDEARAATLYQRGCEGGFAQGCAYWGGAYSEGRGVAADAARAVALFQKACDEGDALGCTYWGVTYSRGLGVAKNEPRAATLFERGCEAGVGLGCTNWALMYRDGRALPRDESRAVGLLQRGCEQGDPNGCFNAGLMYTRGQGVMKDDARAATFYQSGCDGGIAAACTNLGVIYSDSRGVVKDEARGMALYQRGCDGGNGLGCTNLGNMYRKGRGVPKDESRAMTLFRRGCEEGDALGCTLAGVRYLPEGTLSVTIVDRQTTDTTFTSPMDASVSYSVRGATYTLRLPDGRLVVVDCVSKYALKADSINQRSCRMPVNDQLQAEFERDDAKLRWPLSVDGKKVESETYKVLSVLTAPGSPR